MTEIKLEKGTIKISAWVREGDITSRGVKLSISDENNISTTFLSLDKCDKLLVALVRERDEVRENYKKNKKLIDATNK